MGGPPTALRLGRPLGGPTGQRKQAFSEFITKRLKEEKEERRLKQRRARDGFMTLLATDTTIDVRTRWREANARLSSLPRYRELEVDILDEREREEMFNEFIAELVKKEEEEKQQLRKVRSEDFMALLKETSGLAHNMRWLDARATLEAKKDPRFEALEENDRRHLFQDYLGELKKEFEAAIRRSGSGRPRTGPARTRLKLV